MRKMELGEHLDAFFHSQLLKIEADVAFWALAGKKNLFRHGWSFKPKNHNKSLLGPYEGKLQKRFCP
jgi:hypothetical protein